MTNEQEDRLLEALALAEYHLDNELIRPLVEQLAVAVKLVHVQPEGVEFPQDLTDQAAAHLAEEIRKDMDQEILANLKVRSR